LLFYYIFIAPLRTRIARGCSLARLLGDAFGVQTYLAIIFYPRVSPHV
jgi:hypothetical protein